MTNIFSHLMLSADVVSDGKNTCTHAYTLSLSLYIYICICAYFSLSISLSRTNPLDAAHLISIWIAL